MMRKSKNHTGNDRFYGFCVDLLEQISIEVGFGYLLDLVPDRKYGVKNSITGEWNGIVQQLVLHVRYLQFTFTKSIVVFCRLRRLIIRWCIGMQRGTCIRGNMFTLGCRNFIFIVGFTILIN